MGWAWKALWRHIYALAEAAQRCRSVALMATGIPRNQGKFCCVMYVSTLNKIWSQEHTEQQGTSVQITVEPLSLQCLITVGLSMEFVSTALCEAVSD